MAEPDKADPKGESKKDRLARYKARYKVLEDLWSDNRKAALEDMKFASGDQWPEELKKIRGNNRPCLVVDKLNQYVRQVVNDGRQNRPAIKVSPIEDGDEEIAEAYQGLIRHVCVRSNSDAAADTALSHAVESGFGWFRLLTEYANKNTFNQEIKIARVSNRLSVLLGEHQEADGSDAPDGFIVCDMPKAEFKATYTDADKTHWEGANFTDGWADENTVRVCEYYYKEEETTKLHLLADGSTIDDEAYQGAVKELGQEGVPAIVDSRNVPIPRVKWCRMSGVEILEENDWLGKYIPIIPVFGAERNVEGKTTYQGLIRPGKDPQRLYNFSRSAFAERVALTPKVPYIADPEAIAGFEEDWETANTANRSVLRARGTDSNGNRIDLPRREQASDIPAGFAQDMQISEHDIQGALGMYNESLGKTGNATSGKQELARIREADTGTFHFQDNLNRAICNLGTQLVDLIPKVYDSKRIIRILGEDGEATLAEHDPNQQQAVQKMGSKVIYNLNVGTYDVSVSSGPSYTTKRAEAAESMKEMLQGNPNAWMTHGDLYAKSLDWPGADDWAKRSRLTMPPELQQAIGQDEGSQQSPEMQAAQQHVNQAMQQIQQQQAQLQEAGQQLMQEQQKVMADKAATDAERAKLDAARSELESKQKVLQSKYEELSAKIEMEAMKLQMMVPQTMPPGKEEPAISPDAPPPDQMMPQQPNPPPSGFFNA